MNDESNNTDEPQQPQTIAPQNKSFNPTPNSTDQQTVISPNINQQPPLPSTEVLDSAPKTKHPMRVILTILAIVIILVLVAIGSYLLGYQQSNNITKVNSKPINPHIYQGPSQQGPYAGWLTFVDAKRVYEINYPSSWIRTNQSSSGLGTGVTVDKTGVNFAPSLNSNSLVNEWSYYGSLASVFKQQTGFQGSPTAINSYPGLYYQAIYSNSGSTSTTDYYGVYHSGVTVVFTIQISQAGANGGTPFNNSAEIPTFQKIINSINFSVPASASSSIYFPINSSTKFLKITQLGIELPETSSLTGMYYLWDNNTNSAVLFVPSLDRLAAQKYPNSCKPGPVTKLGTSSDLSIGSISKGFAGPDYQMDIRKINNNYYDLASPGSGCNGNNNHPSVENLYNSLGTSLVKSFAESKTY